MERALNAMASTASVREIPSSPHLPIPADRRFKSRYPLDTNVRFRSLAPTALLTSEGRAVNMSSDGVLVVSEQPLSEHEFEVGAHVEIRIEWPSLLNGTVPLQLLATGWIVRRNSDSFAATFERCQFRTMKSSSENVTEPHSNGHAARPPLY